MKLRSERLEEVALRIPFSSKYKANVNIIKFYESLIEVTVFGTFNLSPSQKYKREIN